MPEYVDPPHKTFEDFSEGDAVVTRGRTVDVGDFTVFAGLTGDHYPLHTDASFAEGTQFGERIAHGPLTFAIAVGLVGMSNFYGDALVALVEIEGLRALKPVRSGDTLRVRAEIVALESSEDQPKYGTVRVSYHVLNQHDDEVMQFTQSMLARRGGRGGSHG